MLEVRTPRHSHTVPILQLLARRGATPTAHTTSQQHAWIYTHFKPIQAAKTSWVEPSTACTGDARCIRTIRCIRTSPVWGMGWERERQHWTFGSILLARNEAEGLHHRGMWSWR